MQLGRHFEGAACLPQSVTATLDGADVWIRILFDAVDLRQDELIDVREHGRRRDRTVLAEVLMPGRDPLVELCKVASHPWVDAGATFEGFCPLFRVTVQRPTPVAYLELRQRRLFAME